MPDRLGAKIIGQLRARKLPQMVDWFDPSLLVRIGIRDIISGTIGQYADQRLMQAASDRAASEEELALRYDYSNPREPDHNRRVDADESGAVWIDYIADLGDGFEATYAMAYLMAADRLEVTTPGGDGHGTLSLKAGEILVMGGDQAYPQATAEEYEKRLVNPYTWANKVAEPTRKLFAIPGNHDWYDGLGAFTSLFTAARSRISGGLGRQVGGWRSMQHRSYFAIKLPHDWWIWGPDIQLGGTLDDPQRDYFDIVGDYTKPGDKIVLCLAEPSWLHENYENLHEVNLMARKRGAKICAILAGDWHHYSRYFNEQLGIQFVTSGGGGAFAHATHQLKPVVTLQWATGVEDGPGDNPGDGDAPAPRGPADDISTGALGLGFMSTAGTPAALPATPQAVPAKAAPEDNPRYRKFKAKFARDRKAPDRKHGVRLKNYDCVAETIYPSKAKSRLLSLRNLLLPFHNRSFAMFVGFIYFLYAWVFQTSAAPLDENLFKFPETGAEGTAAMAEIWSTITHAFWEAISGNRVLDAATKNPAFFFMLLGLWAGLVYYVELGSGLLKGLVKLAIGTAHFLAHLNALLFINLIAFAPALLFAAVPGMLVGALGLAPGSEAFWNSIGFLLSYSLLSMFIGGLVGAAIMGIYWTLTCVLFNMHCGDAFGALGIKDYKHFLRLKFEADKLTIYPIAIDKVPGRKQWHAATGPEGGTQNAQIVPNWSLAPHLIEDPIVIHTASISTTLQKVE